MNTFFVIFDTNQEGRVCFTLVINQNEIGSHDGITGPFATEDEANRECDRLWWSPEPVPERATPNRRG